MEDGALKELARQIYARYGLEVLNDPDGLWKEYYIKEIERLIRIYLKEKLNL